jgi:ABC-type lipoprotein release transport system permease subunit
MASTRILESFLFNIDPLDPVVFAGAIATLLVVAAVASIAPARRAARVDPVQALRN